MVVACERDTGVVGAEGSRGGYGEGGDGTHVPTC